MRPRHHHAAGFTLAEAAITIALVALTLSTMLQILQGSKFITAHARDMRIARDMALLTLGEIESGVLREEIDMLRSGNYADLDHPEFYFELALGDESLPDTYDEDDPQKPFDNWAWRREQQLQAERDAQRNGSNADDEEDEYTEPFEKVKIRVTFPKYGDLPNEIVLDRWIPWEQVYGPSEEDEAAASDAGSGDAGGAGSGSGSSSSSGAGGSSGG